jgi:NADH:ubiquinone oxidoreductase subunit 4 (subunit M)
MLDFAILLPIIVIIIGLGVYPQPVFDWLQPIVEQAVGLVP